MPPGPRRSTPPLCPLGELVRSLPGVRGGGARPAAAWKELDARHGTRPDWLLWRRLLSGGPPPTGCREDAVALALRALKSREREVALAALALLPGVKIPAGRTDLVRAAAAVSVPPEAALVSWLVGVCQSEATVEAALERLRKLQTLLPTGWKPGRPLDLTSFCKAPWLAVEPARLSRWCADAVARLARQAWAAPEAGDWLLTAWQLRREARPAGALPRFEDTVLLLDAAATNRLQGELTAAARLEALALHLLPPRLPEPVQVRCRAAAWRLAEAGLTPPQAWRVRLEGLPFPGDPPSTPVGLEAARQWEDGDDPALRQLRALVEEDADWAVLRSAGVVLRYPLAALGWVAKRALAHQVKKQHDLLDAAVRLAFRHQALGSLGRLLAVRPGSAANVVEFARALRAGLRAMPFLRDEEAWTMAQSLLRQAWGRLETEIGGEDRFLLHETLQDRLTTTLRRLPQPWRVAALRHRHSRRSPSDLVRDLEADWRSLNLLEHQRRLELWELAAMLRERPDLATTVWVSVVAIGDPARGRASVLVLGPRGQREMQVHLRAEGEEAASALAAVVTEAVQAVAEAPEWLVLATDPVWRATAWEMVLRQSGLTASVVRVPGWEWAFRVLREPPPEVEQAGVWLPEGATLPPRLPAATSGCWLLAGDEAASVATRWHPATGEGPVLRSLALGAQARVIGLGPVVAGEAWGEDLIALSFAQSCRSWIAPLRPLTAAEQEAALPLLESGKGAELLASGNWQCFGLPPVDSSRLRAGVFDSRFG
jgi:hypothetical protein